MGHSMDEEKEFEFDSDDPEYNAYSAELEHRKLEPLNTELRCYVQAHTLERLKKYVNEQMYKKATINSVVNEAIRTLLFDEGY